MTVQAVVFDIGNVLIEWQPENFFDREVGEERRREMFAAIDLHAMNDRIDSGENFSKVVRETEAAHPDFAHEIAMWHDRWLELAAPVIPHSVRLMRALRSKGIPVHALTNFGVETFALAQTEYDFLTEFDMAFVSGHLQVIKPAPAIYAAVEAGTGLTGEALLFADDRPDNVAAAEARGWRAHLFDGPEGWAARLVAEGLLTEEDAA
ncbi:HAD family hydrolase [Jannaschia seohaensis]|uniref:2-haloacid dehalogenase n=1 Tax=Jannaschia seohaensis TaxID=475081 RepID=A0A2Y9AST9_9RHOB|nr:HAD family phosphatase [Jannaschia seohaensis]PWJ17447.1 2-haloacid dehalogenase [Jannaschia seohaensis]SSA47510.1 2-haloacid dehalogenase [Jannaschia seohaensis]